MRNFIIALRALKNYRLYSVVNIVGLALSLACVITISRYIYSELTVDTMHSKKDNIYCVLTLQRGMTQYSQDDSDNINGTADFVDISDDPAVLEKTAVIRCPSETLSFDNHDYEVDILTTDSSFTRIFDFECSIGSLSEVVSSVDKVAITRECAAKIFGDSDPLGKTVVIKQKNFTVSAILSDPTSKSSMQFDMILPTVEWKLWMMREAEYFLMPDAFDYRAFNDKYPKYFEVYSGMAAGQKYSIKPFSEMYFDSSVANWNGKMRVTGNRDSLEVIFIVALIVLCIGVFNFINIYTVLMLRRAREVGIKKVFGASITSVTFGLYLENLLMVTLSLCVGWVIALICREFAASVLGIPIVANQSFDIWFSVAFMLLLPILTTIYPYFKYRYAKPITSLREVGSSGRSIVSRAIFLVIQYVMTIVMIIVSIYLVRQLNYVLNSDLGYKHNDIISARLFADTNKNLYSGDSEWEERKKREREMISRAKIVRDKLSQSPIVTAFSHNESPHIIGQADQDRTVKLLPDGRAMKYSNIYCDDKFFTMYGIEKLQGRLWSDTLDKFAQYKCIVNETLMRELGIDDYSTASIQTNARLWWSAATREESELMKHNPPFTIVGVVRDFQIGHLRSKIPPLMILYSEYDNADIDPTRATFQVQAVRGRMAEVVELLRELHSEYGNGEFSYTIVDDEIAAQYAEDRKVTNIYTVFAIIAIFIGSLGLFSLSLYDVQQRYREIALRRVNGASVSLIVVMLLRKYYLLLSIAYVIAMPVAWFAIDWYMQGFVNRAPISWWIFALAALVTAAISLLTLIYQTIKAARTNPAVAMKTE